MIHLQTREKGFTLIEIVLVLALAALIIAMVFLALSGAQKSRRDTQRKQALSQIVSQLEQYASNNSGIYPASVAAANTAMASYLYGTSFIDPLTGTIYGTSSSVTTSANPVTFSATAAPPSGIAASTVSYSLSGNIYTVCMGLEAGGTDCQGNK